MNKALAKQGKLKGHGLVRNQYGQPQFDDWDNIPEVFHSVLTDEDWIYISEQREKQHGNNAPG